MTHKKKNTIPQTKTKPKKGFNPNPSLKVSKEELDKILNELLTGKSKEDCTTK